MDTMFNTEYVFIYNSIMIINHNPTPRIKKKITLKSVATPQNVSLL